MVWRPAPCRLLNICICHCQPPRKGGFTIDNSGSIKYRTRPYDITLAMRQHPLSNSRDGGFRLMVNDFQEAVTRLHPPYGFGCRLLNICICYCQPPRTGGFIIDNSGKSIFRTRPYGLTPALRQHPLSDEVVMVGFG